MIWSTCLSTLFDYPESILENDRDGGVIDPFFLHLHRPTVLSVEVQRRSIGWDF